MPSESVRNATDKPRTLDVQPVKLAKPKVGRPKSHIEPRMPRFDLETDEQILYDTFMASFINDYPDIKDYPSDLLLLPLAAVEYIKYLRVIGQELSSREAITMARQHLATQFLRILDTMHVTRKARSKTVKPKEDDETSDFLKALSLEQ